MAKRGIDEHPKTIEFAEQLGIPVCYAVGPLELFWQYVAKVRPHGDITGIKPSAIAHAIRFPLTGDALISALLTAGFLDIKDGSLIVHDWSEHADNAVHAALKKRGEKFADGNEPYTRNRVREARKDAAAQQDNSVEETGKSESSQTVCKPVTNGSPITDESSRSPVRTWPEPDTRYQIPEPEEGEAPPAPLISLSGIWAPLGTWLDDPRLRQALSEIETRRATDQKLRPVTATQTQALAEVLGTNEIGIEGLLTVLASAEAKGWKSVNPEAVVRVFRGIKSGQKGTGNSGQIPDRETLWTWDGTGQLRKPKPLWTPEDHLASEAELARVREAVTR